MPAGFLTEDGPRPDLAEAFGAVELPGASYATRRCRNVAEADAVLLFGDRTSPGAVGLIRDCRELGRPWVGNLRPGRWRGTVSKDHRQDMRLDRARFLEQLEPLRHPPQGGGQFHAGRGDDLVQQQSVCFRSMTLELCP